MKNKRYWIILLVLALIAIMVIIVIRGTNNQISTQPVEDEVGIQVNNGQPLVLDLTPQTQPSVDQAAFNDTGYPIHLLEGKILKINSNNPLIFTVNIKLDKIFPEGGLVVKTIMTDEETKFILHEFGTDKESSFNSDTLQADDNILIGIKESNREVKTLNTFTAVKVVKFIGSP